MTKLSVLLIVCLLFSVFSTTNATIQDGAKREATLSPVRLLPEYKIRWASDIDSWGGTIWNDAGLKIVFHHDLYGGVLADQVDKNEVVWQAEQQVNGQQVICVYTKSNHFIVSIPKLVVNFEADIRSQKDLTEMLLMALTWDLTHGYPVAPGIATRLPSVR
jgi:hypothetical protein